MRSNIIATTKPQILASYQENDYHVPHSEAIMCTWRKKRTEGGIILEAAPPAINLGLAIVSS